MNRYTDDDRAHWRTIERIAAHDYAAALRLAANYGRLLAEREMEEERALIQLIAN